MRATKDRSGLALWTWWSSPPLLFSLLSSRHFSFPFPARFAGVAPSVPSFADRWPRARTRLVIKPWCTGHGRFIQLAFRGLYPSSSPSSTPFLSFSFSLAEFLDLINDDRREAFGGVRRKRRQAGLRASRKIFTGNEGKKWKQRRREGGGREERERGLARASHEPVTRETKSMNRSVDNYRAWAFASGQKALLFGPGQDTFAKQIQPP